VVLLLDPPVATEVDTLRSALGDAAVGKIGPHITLVPPVNVRDADLVDALAVLRQAAAGQAGQLELTLGPTATFHPASPVVYLAVGAGEPSSLEALARLHESLLAGPLFRKGRWEWVPHVTLLDEAGPEKITAAVTALSSYGADVVFDRVVLLEHQDHAWAPVADANFGPPTVVGRGGLDLEITEGRVAGPDVLAVVEAASEHGDLDAPAPLFAGQGPTVVLTGRRGGAVAGVAVAWQALPGSGGGGLEGECAVHVGALVEPGHRGLGVARALLRTLEWTVRARGWPAASVVGHGPATFYAHCTGWVTRTDRAGPP
jgi:2'-5' RNA ligase/GNAT superfamily N-acetyltransferase